MLIVNQIKKICEVADISVYPTLRFTRGGRTIDYPYNYDKTYDNIINYLGTMSV